ncbi:MAG: cytochrome c3 family protein [Thermoanaerobaculia bacterium]
MNPLCALALVLALPAPAAASVSGCVECHLALEDARLTPPARAFADDVHAHSGFTCVFCHGGDATKLDQDLAHDAKKGFRGRIAPRDVPELCGRCHADASLMKQFNPARRVDQLAEYRSSGHGKKLAQGDAAVAECASCHGAHGILPIHDSRSPVSPGKIAQTCNRCHGDAALMATRKLPSDVYAKYARSVHFEAREKGDLSAPSCNSCHGNHGAAPPGVDSVANVCGTCHAVFADQFKLSPHWEAFQEMGLPACVTCHENHQIVHPTEAFLAAGPADKCGSCHEAGSAGAKAAAKMREDLVQLELETRGARDTIRRAAEAGMEVSRANFDLGRADDALIKARADVHLFRPAAVREAASAGLTIARSARQAGLRALQERDYRRRGLFVSLGLIGLAVIALILKIRDLDRRRGPQT